MIALFRNTKLFRRLKIVVSAVLLLLAVYLILTSSYVICNVYLPLLSSYLHLHINARAVRFSLFHRNNIRCKDLNVSMEGKIYFSAARFYGHVMLFDLFCGRVSLDRIKIDRSEMVIRKLPETSMERNKDFLSTDRLRIRNLEISDFVFRYAPERTPFFCRFHFDALEVDSFLPDRDNELQLKSELAWQTQEYGLVSFPVAGLIRFRINRSFLLTTASGEIFTEKPYGNMYGTDLSRLCIKNVFEFDLPEDHPQLVNIRKLQIDQMDGARTVLRITAGGVYDLQESAGKGKLHLSAQDANLMFAGPFWEHRCKPEKLNLLLSGDLDIDGPLLTSRLVFHADAAAVSGNSGQVLDKPSADCSGVFVCDFSEGFLRTSDLKCSLRTNGREVLRGETEGALSLRRHPDSSWDVDTTDARLKISICELPMSVLNPVLPVKNSGTMTADYEINVDSRRERLFGSISGHIADNGQELDGKPFIRKHAIQFGGQFQSRSLNDIREIQIPRFQITQFAPDGGKAVDYLLGGRYVLSSHAFYLTGEAATRPFSLLSLFETNALNPVLDKMRALHLEDASGKLSLQLKLQRDRMDFSGEAQFGSFLLPSSPDEVKATAEYKGKMDLRPDAMKLELTSATLSVPDQFLISAKGTGGIRDNSYELQASLTRLTPQFIRNIWSVLREDDPYVDEIVRRLDFYNIDGDFALHCKNGISDLTLDRFRLRYAPKKNSELLLQLKSPLKGNP